jgi:uncharacterized membrane protein
MKPIGLMCAVAVIGLLAGCGGGGGGGATAPYSMRQLSGEYVGAAFINNVGEIGAQVKDPSAQFFAGPPVIISPDGSARTLAASNVLRCFVRGFNDSGQFAASSDTTVLRWDESGNVITLDSNPSSYYYPSAMNNAGWVVGSKQEDDNSSRALLWKPDGSKTELQMVPEYTDSHALDINDGGWIVGYVSNGTQPGQIHSVAVIWGPDGTARKLAAEDSTARSISNAGEIVLTTRSGCFVCDTDGHVRRQLSALPGYAHTLATEMNDRGEVVGWAITSESDDATSHAVYWDPAGHIFDLGAPAEHRCSVATSINNSGVIVGSCADSWVSDISQQIIVVWTPK